jgi:hypothetical protein
LGQRQHPTYAAKWEAQLARLAAYKAAHGDCNVPWSRAEYPGLGRWANSQRVYKKRLDRGEPSPGMTAERAAKLEALGLAWEVSDSHPDEAAWDAQLARLAAYKEAHGDCNVPQRWAEDPRLGRWVDNQRKGKKKLDRGEPSKEITVERAAKLEALGLAWECSKGNLNEAGWEVQLARLAAYKAAHGDCSVPRGWAEDPGLASWVNNQRDYKRKLDRGEPSRGITVERAARLEALGFAWERSKGHLNDTKWEVQLARLVAYKTAHGDCRVPKGWADDPGLASWVNNQRDYKRKLDRGEPSHGMTTERAARLEALGLAWEVSNSHRGPSSSAFVYP